MFDQIFGRYLVKREYLTVEQLEEVIAYESSVRVKLGLIAVTEKLMTQEQADEVNQLQTVMDKRFGDIAVMQGYLTEEQVMHLLKKQDDIYMLFCQTLIDKGYMTLEEVDQALNEYQAEEGFTHSDMDDLVSGDVDRIVRIFLPTNSELNNRLCGIVIRTVIRVIDSGAYVSKSYLTDQLIMDNFAMQKLDGDHKIATGFAGLNKDLLAIADVFAKEEFPEVDLDALDAVGEFTNCVNGLFASELSNENVSVDMLPPEYYESPVTIKGKEFCVLPVHIGEKSVNFVLSIDSEFSVE